MEQSQSRERAREQVYSWGWSVGMESLKSLESGAVVEGENLKFLWCVCLLVICLYNKICPYYKKKVY